MIVNGVDVDKFAGASAPHLTRNMVTLGRFSSNKRLDRLIALAAALRDETPQWHLDICGVPADVSLTALEAEIASHGLEEQVDVHVGLTTSALRDVLGRCSFFVSASEYEGFGLALIEVMSAGLLPVVHHNAAFQAFAAVHPGIDICDFSALMRLPRVSQHSTVAQRKIWIAFGSKPYPRPAPIHGIT
ncbi:glycosyltransferase [Breoghania sp.]|uniref:glycosyltransferase n=1 Tax=Breoghania sp. TaxID=2065378 RepID=UPI0026095E24|nr:glycosyltransferase [Breoghania sp.]MDJ0930996.1 glycosyltransferase [Breoghania sp.]